MKIRHEIKLKQPPDELSVESLIKSRIPPNLQEVVRLIVKMEVERVKK